MPEKQKFGGNNVCMNYYTFNHLNQAKWGKKNTYTVEGVGTERERETGVCYVFSGLLYKRLIKNRLKSLNLTHFYIIP